MQNKTLLRIQYASRAAAFTLAATGALVITGCGAASLGKQAVPVSGATLQGHVFGGQQPVSGSVIQLYAANQLAYGQSSAPLIASTVTTDAGGSFSITGDYTCPYPSSQVYITATGGDTGSGTNANIALMAPLGACGNLSSSTIISINELTTVAGAYALSQFMTAPTQLSTSPTNITGLTNAFATVNKLVNTSIGQLPGNTLPAGATEPTNLLNTLANIIAACVNTDGIGGTSTNCATLFTNTTLSGGPAPTDTLTAALNIAKKPGSNVSTLFGLSSSTAPFQPSLTGAPNAYTVSIHYAPAGVFGSPSAAAIDATGNLWVTNSSTGNITVLDATTGNPTINSTGSLQGPSGIAFDAAGNAWVPNMFNSTLSVFTPAGVGSAVLNNTLNAPESVAIDSQGTVWITSIANKVTAVAVSGTTVLSATNYSTGGAAPTAIAINPH